MRKILRFIVPSIVYLLFFTMLSKIYFHQDKCSYEQNIMEIAINTHTIEFGKYIYDVEDPTIDFDDPFHLAQVRGWLIQPKGEFYGPADADLILASETSAYKVQMYSEKRLDVYYMDQSDPNSKDLFVGFFARFPTKQLPAGEYKVGFLIKENGEESVLWSESLLCVS